MLKNISSQSCESFLTSQLWMKEQIQPNAVDLTLDEVFAFSEDSVFEIDNEMKVHRKQHPVDVLDSNANTFVLTPGSYRIVFKEKINIGDQEAGFVVPRSTFIRNGVFIHSGLYDSGYTGRMEAGMNVTAGCMNIKKNTRIGQILIFDAEALHLYDGDYQDRLTGAPAV